MNNDTKIKKCKKHKLMYSTTSFKSCPEYNKKNVKKTYYIPIEKLSTRQYLSGIKRGLWGGVVEQKYLDLTKNNPDNPLVDI